MATNETTPQAVEPEEKHTAEAPEAMGQAAEAAEQPAAAAPEGAEPAEPVKAYRSTGWAVAAIAFTIVAWVTICFGWVIVSIISTLVALATAIVGLKSKLRRWCISMIIASGVLLLVFIIFESAILLLLR